jgi:hypothetical protein
MAPIEALRIEPIQLPHAASQISCRRFDEQMIVIAHQAVRVTAPGKAVEHVPDYLKEETPIRVIPKDGLAAVPARGDMVYRSRKFYP